MPAKKGSSNGGKTRRADTGEYAPKKYGEDHPKTTVVEHDKKKKK